MFKLKTLTEVEASEDDADIDSDFKAMKEHLKVAQRNLHKKFGSPVNSTQQ